MNGPGWRIPNEDVAHAAEDEERHRAAYGVCLGPCDHPECHPNDEHAGDETNESEGDQ